MLRRGMLAAGGGGDPHWSSVVSCLNFVGTDGATSTTDAKGLPWTFRGDAQIDTAASANGVSSLLLDGTGDYIDTPDTPAMRTDVPIWTIEAFVRLNASKLQTIFNKRSAGPGREISVYVQASGAVQFNVWSASGTVAFDLVSTATLSLSNFTHLEVVRNNDWWYLFVGGNLEASANYPGSVSTNTDPFRLGRDGSNTGRDLNGWIGGFRRTNGVARHTASFTPPPAPFPEA